MTSSVDLNTRHGAVLGTGEILHALAIGAKQSDCTIQDIVGKSIFLSSFHSSSWPHSSFSVLICMQ
jgi:hypothetical protein